VTATASQRKRRALVSLGAAVALYVFASQLALPWYDRLRAASEQVADKTERLRKYRRQLLHRSSYDAITRDLREKIAEAQQHFFSNDPKELQQIVEDSAKAVGIDLTQRSTTQTKKVDDVFNEITMTMAFESTLGQLVRFLEELRSSPKIVSVRTAQIDPIQVAFEAPKLGELKKTVRVNLTVAGEAIGTTTADKGK
jgi:type II secretory pathway component PulM